LRSVYMDHSATTPVHPRVGSVVTNYMMSEYGNASSAHSYGREAQAALSKARQQVAGLIGAQKSEEIIFTSGGTESNNLAIQGAVRDEQNSGNHIITSVIEHHAVLRTCAALEEEGYKVTFVGVDQFGRVDPDEVQKAITNDTALISIMMASNEVGTIQPINEIAEIANRQGILVHTDAVQAIGQLKVDVNKLGVDMLSISGHKLYAPKGIGALYVRNNTALHPILHGGHHEYNLRPGTENIPGVAGLGEACALAKDELKQTQRRMTRLRDYLMDGLKKADIALQVNGHLHERLPNNVNISIQGMGGKQKEILNGLDEYGIAASGGTTCTSEANAASHVLKAMGISKELAQGSVRLSLGRENTLEDVEYVIEVFQRLFAS